MLLRRIPEMIRRQKRHLKRRMQLFIRRVSLSVKQKDVRERACMNMRFVRYRIVLRLPFMSIMAAVTMRTALTTAMPTMSAERRAVRWQESIRITAAVWRAVRWQESIRIIAVVWRAVRWQKNIRITAAE